MHNNMNIIRFTYVSPSSSLLNISLRSSICSSERPNHLVDGSHLGLGGEVVRGASEGGGLESERSEEEARRRELICSEISMPLSRGELSRVFPSSSSRRGLLLGATAGLWGSSHRLLEESRLEPERNPESTLESNCDLSILCSMLCCLLTPPGPSALGELGCHIFSGSGTHTGRTNN